jgi:NADP-dependent 3-hydroxy acid dehydrogenase YdfG
MYRRVEALPDDGKVRSLALAPHLSESKPVASSHTSAVVTGASRNIGAAIALRLSADGFPVAINYFSENEKNDALNVQSEIRKAGGRAEIYQCDVSQSDQVEQMFKAISVDLGAPSVLVNNAATSVASAITFREIDEAAWDEVTDTNLKGVFLCCKAFDKYSIEGSFRSIINISSIRVSIGMEGNSHYTAAKAALIGLGRVLARELGPSECDSSGRHHHARSSGLWRCCCASPNDSGVTIIEEIRYASRYRKPCLVPRKPRRLVYHRTINPL